MALGPADKVSLVTKRRAVAQMLAAAVVLTPQAPRVLALLKTSMVAMAGSHSFLFTGTPITMAVVVVERGRVAPLTHLVELAVAAVADTLPEARAH